LHLWCVLALQAIVMRQHDPPDKWLLILPCLPFVVIWLLLPGMLTLLLRWLLSLASPGLGARIAGWLAVTLATAAVVAFILLAVAARCTFSSGQPAECGATATVAKVVAALLAPGATLPSYLYVSFWLWRSVHRRPLWLAEAMPIFWLVGYAAAWRVAVRAALEAYDKLPPTPPPGDCYVASAAAHGHPWLVGARVVPTASGRPALVNAQLRRLKSAEVALGALSPAGHRLCRWVYDRLGPPLARRLRSPLVGDLAYLSLKPAEWLAVLAVQLLTGQGRGMGPEQPAWARYIAK
jgi:hypothetical protein